MKYVNRQMRIAGATKAILLNLVLTTTLLVAFAGYASAQVTITTPPTLPPGVVGSTYFTQLTATAPSQVTWSYVSGTLPPTNFQVVSSGAIQGSPTVPGTYVFTVQASAGASTDQRQFSLTISPALQITTVVLPTATFNVPYSTTIAASGGNQPYTWINTTPLPQGLSLDATTGVLSGTPTLVNNPQFIIQVSDSSATPQVQQRTFALSVATTLNISTTTLPDGEAGTPYVGATLVATGGTPAYLWTVLNGTLPVGMSLSPNGTLSGTPSASSTGTFNVTFQVSDTSNPVQTATKSLTFKIFAPLQIITGMVLPTAVVPNGSANNFYLKQIDITSGQTGLTWTVVRGILPQGITLSQTGVLSGTPTNPSIYDFTIQVDGTNPVQTAQKDFRLIVNPPLQITTPAVLPNGFVGMGYSQILAATGGFPPYLWSAPGQGLPQWLSLSSGGVLSAAQPPSSGTFTFSVQVDDSFSPTQTAIRQFSLTINSGLSITTSALNPAFKDVAFSQQLQSTGGTGTITWNFSGGTLPQGLTLSAGGLLSGTPTVLESKTITITATDSRGLSSSNNFTITVNPALPTLSAPNLPATILPANASPVAFQLASAFPTPFSGTLVMTFISKSEVAGDDPLTRFSTGTRSVLFTIPANTTSALFASPVSLSAGTVAGTVRLAANFDNGPQDVTVATTEIASAPPKINNVVALRTGAGLEVQITGYSTSRRVSNAEFTFDFVGGKTQPVTVSVGVGTAFDSWFRSAPSLSVGSAFSYVQSFNVTGAAVADIQSVTVRLTNAQGSTSSSVIPFK
jgi:hypothetical protein